MAAREAAELEDDEEKVSRVLRDTTLWARCCLMIPRKNESELLGKNGRKLLNKNQSKPLFCLECVISWDDR